ncbi:MAG TPA: hypothetical protein VKB93_03535 [Thermoanaerobaculia bacterium]|nr:hypothetical protein [Thermoanaerobaculia bacterium]
MIAGKLFLIFLLLAEGSAFDRAQRAVGAVRMKEALALYAEAARTDADPEKREEAEVRVANIEWRVLHDYDAARTRLRKLGTAMALNELARVAIDRKEYKIAREEATKAIAAAKKKRERMRATILHADAVVRDPAATPDDLRAAVQSMREQEPYLEVARILTKAALRIGDGAAALEGINAYYHVSQYSAPPNAIAEGYAALTRLLPSMKERAQIANALAAIRFFDEAVIVQPGGELGAYAAALHRIEDATNEYYRKLALGGAAESELRAAVKRERLSNKYGLYTNIGKTGGFVDLHMGHIVTDSQLRVEQYGKTATVRFIAIDALVSNGFSEWVRDGAAGDGGWANPKEIYQVRPRYADGPLREWALVTDPERRAEQEKKIAAETALDLERAKANPIQHFFGLAFRMQQQYLQRVAAETKSRDAFIARVEQDEFTSSIVLHEGRHAIDRASGKRYEVYELEYRAKLSEVALAPSPRQALQSVLHFDIGGDSPHAKANELFAKGLAQWMEAHRDAIAGYDPALPPLPQADKLTDEQIVAAVRGLDPMAK